MPERRDKMCTFKTRPRNCGDVFGAIYAVGGLSSAGTKLAYHKLYHRLYYKLYHRLHHRIYHK